MILVPFGNGAWVSVAYLSILFVGLTYHWPGLGIACVSVTSGRELVDEVCRRRWHVFGVSLRHRQGVALLVWLFVGLSLRQRRGVALSEWRVVA